MVTRPSTTTTNVGALKIVLVVRYFALWLVFVVALSAALGWAVDLAL